MYSNLASEATIGGLVASAIDTRAFDDLDLIRVVSSQWLLFHDLFQFVMLICLCLRWRSWHLLFLLVWCLVSQDFWLCLLLRSEIGYALRRLIIIRVLSIGSLGCLILFALQLPDTLFFSVFAGCLTHDDHHHEDESDNGNEAPLEGLGHEEA